ncbi:hypothetical protein J7337_006103 [Fusarium musae]|uniref:Uncharacterized protein n=1 Tax=Fusarium musae TaxID=1042133 RepID=A0A9P8DJS1_9HYPO|nr:hypothetical protein J7337_006103 [Fusarium musae]KAG9503260.1 hypothetical protein J7337_006103 [Fusarium musae]
MAAAAAPPGDGDGEEPWRPPPGSRAVGHYLCKGDSKDKDSALPSVILFPYKQYIDRLLNYSRVLDCVPSGRSACMLCIKHDNLFATNPGLRWLLREIQASTENCAHIIGRKTTLDKYIY